MKKILLVALVVSVGLLISVAGYFYFQKTHEQSDDSQILSFFMEDGFQEIPADVFESLVSSETTKEFLGEGCKQFVGRKLDAVGEDKNGATWVATTSSACGWGAHTAPIWVVASLEGKYAVVLNTGGSGVVVYKARWHGMSDIAVSDAGAAYYADKRFRFNGSAYTEINSRYVEADDPEACKKAPDIFSCE